MEILISLLIVIIGILLFICYNLYKKVSIYEPAIEYYEIFYTKFAELLVFVETKLLELDSRARFSSDDEVGIAFNSIKGLWKLLIDMGLQVQNKSSILEEKSNQVENINNLPSAKKVRLVPTSNSPNAVIGRRIV